MMMIIIRFNCQANNSLRLSLTAAAPAGLPPHDDDPPTPPDLQTSRPPDLQIYRSTASGPVLGIS